MVYRDVIEIVGEQVEKAVEGRVEYESLSILYENIPEEGDIVAITEMIKFGVEDTLQGYDGRYEGTIQLYTRMGKMGQVQDMKRLQEIMYRSVKKVESREVNGIYIERIGIPEVQSVYRDNQDNLIEVMTFYTRYKRKI